MDTRLRFYGMIAMVGGGVGLGIQFLLLSQMSQSFSAVRLAASVITIALGVILTSPNSSALRLLKLR